MTCLGRVFRAESGGGQSVREESAAPAHRSEPPTWAVSTGEGERRESPALIYYKHTEARMSALYMRDTYLTQPLYVIDQGF